jgi:hypothetical protein
MSSKEGTMDGASNSLSSSSRNNASIFCGGAVGFRSRCCRRPPKTAQVKQRSRPADDLAFNPHDAL